MEEGNILEKLGVEWKLLLAQVVNFFLLLVVLRKYAYRPILRALEKRERAIAKSVDDAKAVEQNLAKSARERERMLEHAQKDANVILAEARSSAEGISATMKEEAQQRVAAILAKAEVDARLMKNKVVDEARAELGRLVVGATEKVIRQKLTAKADEDLVRNALKQSRT